MILERIKQYIDYKGLTISSFERSIGMANASFGKSLKNKGAIGSDKLEKILNTYPEISPEWLMTGKGDMLKTKRISVTPPIMDRDYNDTFEDKDTENKSHTQEPDGSKNIEC